MHKLVVVILIISLFSLATPTNNVHRFVIKHGAPAAIPSSAYTPPDHVPTSYRYDVRVNPFKYGYPPAAPVSPYAIPAEYLIPPPVPAYVSQVPVYPSSAPKTYKQNPTGYIPAVPAPSVAYIPSHVLAQILQAHQFIGRHYQPGHYH